jgi:hypothetical protein
MRWVGMGTSWRSYDARHGASRVVTIKIAVAEAHIDVPSAMASFWRIDPVRKRDVHSPKGCCHGSLKIRILALRLGIPALSVALQGFQRGFETVRLLHPQPQRGLGLNTSEQIARYFPREPPAPVTRETGARQENMSHNKAEDIGRIRNSGRALFDMVMHMHYHVTFNISGLPLWLLLRSNRP